MGDQFKKTVLEWNNIQEKIKNVQQQIAPYQDKIKGYKNKADDLEREIVKYMGQNNLGKSKLELGDVIITMGESKKTESMNREYMLRRVKEYLRDEKEAEKLVEFVYGGRSQTITNCLKRKEPKKPKK